MEIKGTGNLTFAQKQLITGGNNEFFSHYGEVL